MSPGVFEKTVDNFISVHTVITLSFLQLFLSYKSIFFFFYFNLFKNIQKLRTPLLQLDVGNTEFYPKD